ncbi:MAG: hypothetical protein EOP15_00990 [Pseudomonas sp.]|nr:MAG: hypothetical protein EOP15_00990 [Pseudomonas sp.]
MSDGFVSDSVGGEGEDTLEKAGSKAWRLSGVQFIARDTKKVIYELQDMVVNLLSDDTTCRMYISFSSKPLGYRIKPPAKAAVIALSLLQRTSSGYSRIGDDLVLGTVYLDCIARQHSFNQPVDPLIFQLVDKVDFVRTVVAFNPC